MFDRNKFCDLDLDDLYAAVDLIAKYKGLGLFDAIQDEYVVSKVRYTLNEKGKDIEELAFLEGIYITPYLSMESYNYFFECIENGIFVDLLDGFCSVETYDYFCIF